MKKRLLILSILLSMSFTGCASATNTTENISSIVSNIESAVIEETTEAEVPVLETVEPGHEASRPAYIPTTDFEKLQNYFAWEDLYAVNWLEGYGPYVEINNNKPCFEEITTEVFEEYSELDELGRCGIAFANICTELQPTEERGNIGSIKPSGWQTANYNEYPGLVDGNYLYNRSHLIGFQLAGENANEKNLITGTRYMNVEGMLPFENKIDDYLEDNPDNHVLYRVTPAYIGDDLVAQGVLMEAYSVEDDGALQFCVWCYNVQPSISIDYSNGDNWVIEKTTVDEEAIIYDKHPPIIEETVMTTDAEEKVNEDVTYNNRIRKGASL